MHGARYEVRFEGGRQRRYFADRQQLLRAVLRLSLQVDDPRFEVWEDAGPVELADGRTLGRRFRLSAVLDFRKSDLWDRLAQELEAAGGG